MMVVDSFILPYLQSNSSGISLISIQRSIGISIPNIQRIPIQHIQHQHFQLTTYSNSHTICIRPTTCPVFEQNMPIQYLCVSCVIISHIFFTCTNLSVSLSIFVLFSEHGCALNDSYEWLQKNFGPFSIFVELEDLFQLNMVFEPVCCIYVSLSIVN